LPDCTSPRVIAGLGHDHDHEDEGGVQLDDLLGAGAAERQVLLELVVLDAVGLTCWRWAPAAWQKAWSAPSW
jgi:hypothetical protein